VGTWSGPILSDRMGDFTGHHCMEPSQVPGVLLCSRGLPCGGGRLEDVAASVLKDFGVGIADGMTGQALY